MFVSIKVICNSCSRSIIERKLCNNRVCFPSSNINSAPRTDEDYQNCINEEYHNNSP